MVFGDYPKSTDVSFRQCFAGEGAYYPTLGNFGLQILIYYFWVCDCSLQVPACRSEAGTSVVVSQSESFCDTPQEEMGQVAIWVAPQEVTPA